MIDPEDADAALRESEERYRTLFEAIDEGFCVIEMIVDDTGASIDYRFLEINPAFEVHTGIRNAVGRRMREIAPTHEAHWFEMYDRVSRTGEAVRFQNKAEALGRYYDVYAFRIGEPEQRRIAVLFNDITERKQAEDALRASEERLREAFNAEIQRQQFFNLSSALMVEAGFDGRLHRVNSAWERLLGWTNDELTSRPWLEFVHPEDRAATEAAALQLFEGAEVVNFENRYRHRDGSYRWINWNVSASPEQRMIYGVAQDVSARKASEEQLRRSHDTFLSLIENAPFGVYLVDAQFRLAQVSAGSRRAFSSVQPLLGREFAEVLRIVWPEPFAREILERFRHTLATGEPYHSADTTEQRGDTRMTESYDWRIERVMLPDGQFGVVCYFYELTDLQRAQDVLRAAERMEVVGRLAGGVAHEANNQMTVVLGSVAFALQEPGLSAAVRNELEQIRRAGERTAGVTRQLLAFSRQQILRPAPMDLNATIREFEPVLRRILAEVTTLTLKLSPRLGPVIADRSQIEQVLVNLVLNARDAMPDGGAVVIKTDAVVLPSAETQKAPAPALPPGDYALLEVTDTGGGIPASLLSRIFEPFFTTKPLGEGSGLGLSTAYGIVKQMGGEIRVQSTAKRGTKFRIYLPLTKDAALPPPAPKPAPVTRGLGTILVVEDEPGVRSLAARALVFAGYDVLEAEHGRAALELLARYEGSLAAVVADIAMPEMNGTELVRRLAQSHPTVPVLLMSGHPTGEGTETHGGRDRPILEKPFHPKTLVERVRELVTGSA